MNEPTRFRDAGSDGPDALRRLFRAAKPPEALSEATQAALAVRVAAIAAMRTPLIVKALPWLLGAAAVGGGAVALHAFAPPRETRGAEAVVTSAPVVVPRSSAVVPPPLSGVTEADSAGEPSVRPRPRASAPIAAPKPSTALGDTLSGEAQLLNEAHRALASDPNKALAVAREHAKRYPQGQLAAERELIEVQALVKLGRAREAESRGRELRKNAPKSIYDERLDKVLRGP